jgi:peptidoglycan/LPS O-acetylase OafA/YrhL
MMPATDSFDVPRESLDREAEAPEQGFHAAGPTPGISATLLGTRQRIATLDSLRGVAALIVVVHHIWWIFFSPVHVGLNDVALSAWDAVQAQNHRAVLGFFVLSGFSIALTTKTSPPVDASSISDYLHRRLCRIVPLFYFSILLTAALGRIYGYASQDFGWPVLLGNLLFLQTSSSDAGNWFPPFGRNGPYWSLSYEMFYYLVLPVALMLIGRARDTRLAPRFCMILIGLASMFVGLMVGFIVPNPFSSFAAL